MKLIRTRHSTIEPIEIDEGKIRRGEVRYAILSHRWGAHEISYQDAVNSTDRRKEIEGTKGYHKVRQFCEKVKSEYEYAWVDTCCINKESSAELSEAINSMYRWYQMAGVCYAYLNDVNFSTDKSQLHANIERSLWFTRGWTLQELIAPPDVRFLASDWREIGTKSTLSLLISKITLIDERILLRQVPLHDVSIAQRMSWASRRVTSRIEDIAYCLMGIFDVNMPLLYGEGEKAFIRLQEEIMKSSEDQTIFAWERHDVSRSSPSGLLAQSPADYILSTTMIPFQCSAKDLPFEVTNRDIQFSQHFSNQIQATDEHTDITLILNCLDTSASSLVGLELQKSKDKTSFVRIAPQLHRHIAWSEFHCAEYASISATKRLPPLYRGADMMEALDDKSMKRAEIPESAHKGKNIIVFIDWRESHMEMEKESNLQVIHRLVQDSGDSQVSYYDVLLPNGDFSLELCVEDAYEWLRENFSARDKIFLFGFAAGTVAILELAQILDNVGIHPDSWGVRLYNQELLRGAIDGSKKTARHSTIDLKAYWFSRELATRKRIGRAAFMGLLDSVEPQEKGIFTEVPARLSRVAMPPSEVSHPASIIRHAISIDELDPKLRPIFPGKKMPRGTQDIKQVWFAGCHHDIGGIPCPDNRSQATSLQDSNLRFVPLAWMIRQATEAGMTFNIATANQRLDSLRLELSSICTSADVNSSTALPKQEPLSFTENILKTFSTSLVNASSRLRKFQTRHWRHIPDSHAVHSSAIGRMVDQPGYRPENLSRDWILEKTLEHQGLLGRLRDQPRSSSNIKSSDEEFGARLDILILLSKYNDYWAEGKHMPAE